MTSDNKTTPLHTTFTVDGDPVLGTYLAKKPDDLAACKDAGMNIIIGDKEDLDPTSASGKYLHENGIKVLYHMTKHVYNRPRLAAPLSTDETTIPLSDQPYGEIPESGVIALDDELVRYESVSDGILMGCTRGYDGTTAAPHRANMILFFPGGCEEDINQVKDSLNLWGYYTLDDSPGDGISALRGIYRAVKRLDPDRPVTAGYGSPGSIVNFGSEVCDIMLIYWYPVTAELGYDRTFTARRTQALLGAARKTVPGIEFIGVYQTFAEDWGTKRGVPTDDQVREQIEDFVREGACGLISFLCQDGWAKFKNLGEVVKQAHKEIRETGGLVVRDEDSEMTAVRRQPTGHWQSPKRLEGYVPAWHVVGPFEDTEGNKVDSTFPPDDGIDLEAVYENKTGRIHWIERQSTGGVVGFGELIGSHSYTIGTVAYATCTVISPTEQHVQMRICTDDDGIICLNDEQVFRYEGERGIEEDADMVEVTLPKGESKIVGKIYNRAGMWALYVRFTDLDGVPIEGLEFSPE